MSLQQATHLPEKAATHLVHSWTHDMQEEFVETVSTCSLEATSGFTSDMAGSTAALSSTARLLSFGAKHAMSDSSCWV